MTAPYTALPWIDLPHSPFNEAAALKDAGLVLDFNPSNRTWFARGPKSSDDVDPDTEGDFHYLTPSLGWSKTGPRYEVGGTRDTMDAIYVRSNLSFAASLALPAYIALKESGEA